MMRQDALQILTKSPSQDGKERTASFLDRWQRDVTRVGTANVKLRQTND